MYTFSEYFIVFVTKPKKKWINGNENNPKQMIDIVIFFFILIEVVTTIVYNKCLDDLINDPFVKTIITYSLFNVQMQSPVVPK